MMKCARKDHGDETTLEIEGTLDESTAPELRTVVEQILADWARRATFPPAFLTTLALAAASGRLTAG